MFAMIRDRGRFSGDEQDLERSQRVRIEHHGTDVDVVTVGESQAVSARLADERFLAVNVHRRVSGEATSAMMAGGALDENQVSCRTNTSSRRY